jgi:hypothetical protein
MSAQQFSSAPSASIVSDIITTPPSVVVGRYSGRDNNHFLDAHLHDCDAYRDLLVMHQIRPQGPLRRPQAHREIRAQGKHDERNSLMAIALGAIHAPCTKAAI